MTELKTLKDLECDCPGCIKDEAIEWVKEYRNSPYIEIDEAGFKKFHNITEGDLK